MNKMKTTRPFAIPMAWLEPKNRVECCFRCVSVTGFLAKIKHNIV